MAAAKDWQTSWTAALALGLPNEVALQRGKLLGLMSYELDEKGLAVEILYVENVHDSSAKLLHHAEGGHNRYAKALFAYVVQISLDAGFDGVVVFKAKTSDLVDYYMRAFGARRAAAYDPFRMIIWEDAAEQIATEFRRNSDG